METTDQIGFNNEKYLKEQTPAILERVNRFKDKLYLEFEGKTGIGKPEMVALRRSSYNPHPYPG
jgi:hypothetical protein